MSHWMKRIVVVGLVVAAAVSVIGTAAAQGPGGRGRGPAADMGMQPGGLFGPRAQVGAYLMDAVMDATGLSLVEVHSALDDGQSLTELLEANGADVQAVVDSVTAAVTAEIDAAVADGSLTEAQATAYQEQLAEHLDWLVSGDSALFGAPLRNAIQLRGERSLIGVLAELAGVDVAELVSDVAESTTLAELAESLGLEADAVIAEAEARMTEEVNSRVEAGVLTEEQAAALLENLNTHLTERFNAPLFGGMYGWAAGQSGFGRGMAMPRGGMMDDFGRGMGMPRGGMMDNFGRGMGMPRGGMMDDFGRGMGPNLGDCWMNSDDGTLES